MSKKTGMRLLLVDLYEGNVFSEVEEVQKVVKFKIDKLYIRYMKRKSEFVYLSSKLFLISKGLHSCWLFNNNNNNNNDNNNNTMNNYLLKDIYYMYCISYP